MLQEYCRIASRVKKRFGLVWFFLSFWDMSLPQQGRSLTFFLTLLASNIPQKIYCGRGTRPLRNFPCPVLRRIDFISILQDMWKFRQKSTAHMATFERETVYLIIQFFCSGFGTTPQAGCLLVLQSTLWDGSVYTSTTSWSSVSVWHNNENSKFSMYYFNYNFCIHLLSIQK